MICCAEKIDRNVMDRLSAGAAEAQAQGTLVLFIKRLTVQQHARDLAAEAPAPVPAMQLALPTVANRSVRVFSGRRSQFFHAKRWRHKRAVSYRAEYNQGDCLEAHQEFPGACDPLNLWCEILLDKLWTETRRGGSPSPGIASSGGSDSATEAVDSFTLLRRPLTCFNFLTDRLAWRARFCHLP